MGSNWKIVHSHCCPISVAVFYFLPELGVVSRVIYSFTRLNATENTLLRLKKIKLRNSGLTFFLPVAVLFLKINWEKKPDPREWKWQKLWDRLRSLYLARRKTFPCSFSFFLPWICQKRVLRKKREDPETFRTHFKNCILPFQKDGLKYYAWISVKLSYSFNLRGEKF